MKRDAPELAPEEGQLAQLPKFQEIAKSREGAQRHESRRRDPKRIHLPAPNRSDLPSSRSERWAMATGWTSTYPPAPPGYHRTAGGQSVTAGSALRTRSPEPLHNEPVAVTQSGHVSKVFPGGTNPLPGTKGDPSSNASAQFPQATWCILCTPPPLILETTSLSACA